MTLHDQLAQVLKEHSVAATVQITFVVLRERFYEKRNGFSVNSVLLSR